MRSDEEISTDFPVIVKNIINDIRIGYLNSEVDQQRDLIKVKQIIGSDSDKVDLVSYSDVDMFLKLNFGYLKEGKVFTNIDRGNRYRERTEDEEEEPPIKKLTGYNMKKGVDYARRRTRRGASERKEDEEAHFISLRGVSNIRNHIKNKMEKERREIITMLARKGYPQIEVEGFSVTVKTVMSHKKPGEISVKMPEKISKDVIHETGNLISEIKVDIRTRKETII